MNLKIQIFSFIYSFAFGIFFGILFKLFYKILFCVKKVFCLVNTFLFVGIMSLFYFIILMFINNGIIHVYFLILILLGFFLYLYIYERMRK